MILESLLPTRTNYTSICWNKGTTDSLSDRPASYPEPTTVLFAHYARPVLRFISFGAGLKIQILRGVPPNVSERVLFLIEAFGG